MNLKVSESQSESSFESSEERGTLEGEWGGASIVY